jgi:hypothetical protein
MRGKAKMRGVPSVQSRQGGKNVAHRGNGGYERVLRMKSRKGGTSGRTASEPHRMYRPQRGSNTLLSLVQYYS